MTLLSLLRGLVDITKFILAAVFLVFIARNYDWLQNETVTVPVGSVLMLIGYSLLRQ
ncbi:hypothetical protein MettiDRAFT_0751 [Methanolobus tindarius DSM 2278]|uniref:Uncharacterized protein n=1 Tax=Methanolobus tindarius DSM 2278 TaxID=1090322 RepID=W9DV73_METTI|nr:hypothetical protein [Methanolobus tindarius]ETA67331.1 hypothetical protein MettiDRAFT_0751 [Methanolobus tindarius DSM 2278]